ncbi:unnamed protein product, partial [Brenthis ino]
MHRLAIFFCVLVLSTMVLCEDHPNQKSDHHPSEHPSNEHHQNEHHQNEHHQNEQHHEHQNDHQKQAGSNPRMPEMPKMPDGKPPGLNN